MWRAGTTGRTVNLLRRLRFTKQFHASWLALWLSVGIIIGTYGSLYSTAFVGVEWLIVGLCLVIASFVKRHVVSVMIILLAGGIIGLYNGGNQVISQSVYGTYIGQDLVISGRVAEDPSYDSEGDLRFRLRDVYIDDQPVAGEIWVSAARPAEIKRSDNVLVAGKVSKGFGTIPAAIYRAVIIRVERVDYADVARDTRDWFAEGIRTGIREPEASLGSGFLLGQKTALPEKLDSELRLLGLTHIVVASGYNLSILVRYGRRLFTRISRFAGVSISAGLVLAFANVTGFSPSMTRASLITGLSLLAWYYGRKFHPLVLLSVSAAITVIINPTYAWGDIGWLLSFTSFVGVIMLSPLIHAYFWGESTPGVVRQVFIETLSAQILTLPIIAYVFGQYSPLALIANVLILPLIPAAMLLVFIAGIGGLIGVGATLIAWPAETLLGYMTVVVDKLAMQPLADSEVVVSGSGVVVMYLALLCFMVFLWRRTGYSFRDYNIVE